MTPWPSPSCMDCMGPSLLAALVRAHRAATPRARRGRGRRPACGSACRGSGSRHGPAAPRWPAWRGRRSAARAGGGRRPSPASRRRRWAAPGWSSPPARPSHSIEPGWAGTPRRTSRPPTAASAQVERIVRVGAGAAGGQDDVDGRARGQQVPQGGRDRAELVGDVDRPHQLRAERLHLLAHAGLEAGPGRRVQRLLRPGRPLGGAGSRRRAPRRGPRPGAPRGRVFRSR